MTTQTQTQTAEVEATDAPKKREPGTSNLACTIRNHRKSYKPALLANGKKTSNNGDIVAVALLACPFQELVAFVATNFGRTYGHLNPGHNRMCCGNLVRAAFIKGDAPTIEFIAKHSA